MEIDKSIVFQALDWKEFNELQTDDNFDSDGSGSDNETENENGKYIIRLFGRTYDDKSVYVKVLNYTPHFYVELPPRWGDSEIDRLIGELKNKNYRMKENLVKYDVVQRYKFRGFNNNKKINFLRIIFNNSKAMYSFARTLSGKISLPGMVKMFKLDVYESNIDTFLRCIHIRNLNACGWIKIDNYQKISLDDEPSTCDINIACDWTELKPDSFVGGAPFKICSFDIECTSGDGSFPQATRIEDKIIQIGSVFSRYGGDIYKKHIITLGSCDPIDGVEVVSVNTERELLIEWTKLIRKEDPDILTGYNIWGFDEPYMYNRSKHPEINCEKSFKKLSKLYTMDCNFIEKKLSSAALGDNFLRYIDSFGRVQIDLMKVVQRDYKLSKYSLDAVSENFIQDKIIKYNILSPTQLEIESKNLNLLKVGNYVKLIANVELEYGVKEDVDDDEDEGYCDEKYRIISISGNKMVIENEKVNFKTINMNDLGKDIKWGLVKDDIKVNDIFKFQRMGGAERKIIAEYCIQDCVLVSRLLAKLEIVTNAISMANVCHVPLYYLLIRGQGIKSLSLVSKKCRLKQYLIPVLSKDLINDEGYEGATVFEPKTGFYQTYVPVLDYNSLYPSSIIDRNISHETIVIEPQYDNLPGYTYNDVSYNNKDGSITKCRFAKHKDKFGILPEILQELLSERKATRKLMEKEPDAFKRSILDGKQLALKVTANSLYGQLGAATSPICMKELAACTTATGREMLETARYFVENDFVPILNQFYKAFTDNDDNKIEELKTIFLKDTSPENLEFIKTSLNELFMVYKINPAIIYGDTDSVFCNMNITKKTDDEILKSKDGLIHGIRLGQLASIFIKKRLRHPHNLEYEKTFYPFCIMSKKRYVGNKYEDNPNKFKQSSMGIVLKRRDNANIVKKVIGGLVNIMMNENDIEKALTYIRTSIENLLNGNYPITDFITTKTIRATYKGLKITSDSKGKKGDEGTWHWDDVECSQSHVKLSQRMKQRDPGNAPATNDRIPLVAIVVPKKKGQKMLQGDKIEHPDYIKEQNLKIDYLFYLTNQIMNPAVQFLNTLIEKPDKMFKDYISLEELKQNGGISLNNFVITTKTQNNIVDDCDVVVKQQDPLEMYDDFINKKRNNKTTNDEALVQKPKTKKKSINSKTTKITSLYLEFD